MAQAIQEFMCACVWFRSMKLRDFLSSSPCPPETKSQEWGKTVTGLQSRMICVLLESFAAYQILFSSLDDAGRHSQPEAYRLKTLLVFLVHLVPVLLLTTLLFHFHSAARGRYVLLKLSLWQDLFLDEIECSTFFMCCRLLP